ncbi:sensor histidine kinase [Tenacibaculum geojense]|uniref:Sensor histidine kinase n=1 Tax=Tenacibaculum geojense TaxID=915352 RepID=A0ABW3JP74_9FLAO
MIHFLRKYKNLLIVVTGVTILIPLLFITYKVLSTHKSSVTVTLDLHPIIGYTLLTYYIFIICCLVTLFVYWIIKNIKFIINLKNEKAKTELIHLQSQVNPHFFFNILNNLYGLIDKDTNKAKELILKLSTLMRYSIYEGQKSSVTLKQEVNFIQNYLELHKMRYHKNVTTSFNIDIENEELKIMPLMYIILVENAFKHGVEVLRDNPFVHISLASKQDRVTFTIENNFDVDEITNTGIGLKNLKQRLQLVYPKKHQLLHAKKGNVYSAKLILQL